MQDAAEQQPQRRAHGCAEQHAWPTGITHAAEDQKAVEAVAQRRAARTTQRDGKQEEMPPERQRQQQDSSYMQQPRQNGAARRIQHTAINAQRIVQRVKV